MRRRYLGQSVVVEHLTVAFDEATLLRAAVKYGRAVAHVARMARHLRQAAGPRLVELEVSVDETETPTSPAEHYWVANELNRLGVEWVSLAPRFVGRFEKGVDYIGDLGELEKDIAAHAALARHFGPYKLSLHSGSDKFSVYPIAARLAQGLVHLKTAGTSYLEALRTVAAVEPAFFRAIYAFARERYDTDKASYHVSAELAKAPAAKDVPEDGPPGPPRAVRRAGDPARHLRLGPEGSRAGREAPLQGHALRPAALEPRGLRRQPRAPLRQAPSAALPSDGTGSSPWPRGGLPAGRGREGDRPRGARSDAARRPARAGAHPRRDAHHADAAPLRRARRGGGAARGGARLPGGSRHPRPDERRAALAARRARGRERQGRRARRSSTTAGTTRRASRRSGRSRPPRSSSSAGAA